MKKSVLKFLPLMAAMILAASCGNNDKDPVTPQPAPSKSPTEVTDNGDGTFTVPFSVKVSNGNSLSKKMEYSENQDGTIKIDFNPETGTDSKLIVSGEGVTGELELGKDETNTYVFAGNLTLTGGKTAADLENGIDLNYEYGTALTEPASSGKSLLDLVKTCNHLYKGSAPSNEDEITLIDQNTYLAISMSPCCDHEIHINETKFTVEKSNGRLWIAFPSGNGVKSEELGLDQAAENVKPSVCHRVARQYFTVADGKKVYFSPGNLQYNLNPKADESPWRFAPTQYDKCFEDGDHSSSSGYIKEDHADWTGHEGWIDLFGWGTWTVNGTLNPNSTSTTTSDYKTGVNDEGDFENVCKEGIINALGSGWTTLSHADWVALFDRYNSYGHGKITLGEGDDNIIEGMILLPDTWTNPISGKTFTFNSSSWSNIYTAQEWEYMESAGAVFLPAAGDRYGTAVYDVGGYGGYWSSSASGEDGAYDLYFYSGDVGPDDADDRKFGYSVRLVRAL